MIDSVQLILLIVIIILTILLVILGIQVFYILHDLRKTIKKTNKILDHVDSITANIQEPLEAIASFALGARASSLFGVFKLVKSFLGRTRESDERSERV
jgi:hypothetical protein